ncbi:MAG: nitroreductase family protein, partial [Nostoc sp.]
IQCSGIGAYYDEETQELLETNKDVLYGMVIGR